MYLVERKEKKMKIADGSLNQAEMSIGDSVIMMGKASDENQMQNTMLYVYAENNDATYKKALEKGAGSVMEPADQFYGDRNAGIKDKDGISWWIATHVEDVSPEEIQSRNMERERKKSNN